MSAKLIIFDLDGVLIDACEWHFQSLNDALSEICNYKISRKDHESIFNGIPTKKKLNILSKQNLLKKIDHDLVFKKKQEYTIDKIKNHAGLDVDKIEMIKLLKKQGHIVACFTNSIEKTAHLMLKKIGVFELLDMIITNQDVKNSKPSPEGYFMVIDEFNMSIGDVIIIEDSPKGLEAAYKTGAHVIPVMNATQVNYSLVKDRI